MDEYVAYKRTKNMFASDKQKEFSVVVFISEKDAFKTRSIMLDKVCFTMIKLVNLLGRQEIKMCTYLLTELQTQRGTQQ